MVQASRRSLDLAFLFIAPRKLTHTQSPLPHLMVRSQQLKPGSLSTLVLERQHCLELPQGLDDYRV